MKSSLIFSLLVIVLHIASAQAPKNLKRVNSPNIIQQGIEQFENQKYEEAEKLFKSIPLGDTLYNFAQYELAYTYTMLDQHNEALLILQNILDINDESVSNRLIYTLMANSYSETDQLEKAIEMYDKALTIYPYHYNIHFNKGVVYNKMKKYSEMEECSKMAIFCNPSHQTSHYQLGISYLRQQYFIPGILALNYAVMLDPNSSVGLLCLQTLDELYAEGFDAFNEGKEAIMSEEKKTKNKKFELLEQLLRSNFSMAKSFKLKTNIKHIIVRQNQLIFENLEYDPTSTEIEDQLYIPTFKMIREGKKDFDIYSYLILKATNVDNNKVLEKAQKMSKSFTGLYGKITVILNDAITKGLGKDNVEGLSYVYYNNYGIESFGKYAVSSSGVKSFDGVWTIIDNEGKIGRIGTYKNGTPDGKWIYFDNNGNRVRETEVKNNKADGETSIYFPNDSNFLKINLHFENNLITGTRYEYNRSGTLIEKSQWKDDYYNGRYTSYYPQGNLKEEINYEKGNINGKFIGYFQDGKTLSYKLDTSENLITYYYPDGKIQMKGFLKENMFVGDFSNYYSNGKIKTKSQFDDQGNETGLWTEYDRKGNIIHTSYFESGKKHGDEVYYFPDEKQNMKIIWKNGIISEAITYNPDGSEKERKSSKNKLITLDYYFTDGNINYLYKRINMKNNGNFHGKYFLYTPDGTILEETDYKDNKKDGISKTYYSTGKLNIYCEYKEGLGNGMYLYYAQNDTLVREGFLKNDLPAYIWYKYHPNGIISEFHLYNENQSIKSFSYYPNGKIETEIIYKNDLPFQINYYNHEEKLLGSNTFNNGNGEHYTYYFNGKISSKNNMKAGDFIGTTNIYDWNGKKISSLEYFEGLCHGKRKTFNEIVPSFITSEENYLFGKEYGIGKQYIYSTNEMTEVNYINGLYEDTTKHYYEKGKPSAIINYADDTRDGISTYFAADGKTIRYQLKFNNGDLYAYAYMQKNGNMSEFLPLGKEKTPIISYYPNGQKSCEVIFENYLRQGKEVVYYPNGKPFRETNNINNKFDGEILAWSENGKLRYKEYYQQDLLNGKCEYYHENGKPKLTIEYESGIPHGTVELYDTNGKITETQKWFYDNRIE